MARLRPSRDAWGDRKGKQSETTLLARANPLQGDRKGRPYISSIQEPRKIFCFSFSNSLFVRIPAVPSSPSFWSLANLSSPELAEIVGAGGTGVVAGGGMDSGPPSANYLCQFRGR